MARKKGTTKNRKVSSAKIASKRTASAKNKRATSSKKRTTSKRATTSRAKPRVQKRSAAQSKVPQTKRRVGQAPSQDVDRRIGVLLVLICIAFTVMITIAVLNDAPEISRDSKQDSAGQGNGVVSLNFVKPPKIRDKSDGTVSLEIKR